MNQQRSVSTDKHLKDPLKVLVVGHTSDDLSHWKQRFQRFSFEITYSLSTSASKNLTESHVVLVLPMGQDDREMVLAKLKKCSSTLKIVMLYDQAIRKTEIAQAVLHSDCDLEDLERALRYVSSTFNSKRGTGAA